MEESGIIKGVISPAGKRGRDHIKMGLFLARAGPVFVLLFADVLRLEEKRMNEILSWAATTCCSFYGNDPFSSLQSGPS